MALEISNFRIEKVLVVDDDERARIGVSMSIKDASFEPILEKNPLPDIKKFIQNSREKGDAAFCDHRLRKGNYAPFDGAQAVAYFYQQNFPAILCTAWSKADLDAMRQFRRFIPVLIKTDDAANPEVIIEGYKKCVKEFLGEFSPSRKPWRSLIRVIEVDRQRNIFYVVLPGWLTNDVIALPLNLVGDNFTSKIIPGLRFHAKVNMGAPGMDELYFYDFEF